ncbi:hypothetical protein HYZ98_03305 [Candidatus Peregrinibacteria bacterium]|nr:hypothetical protein [Candidatus Peregrinibacteria bacterium]
MRPDPKTLKNAPASLHRILESSSTIESIWIGPNDALKLTKEERDAYDLAHKIMCHLAIQAPTRHSSGHPGGPLSSFTFAYFLSKIRDPHVDQPLRMSAGHLSLLAYGLQWLFGREGSDLRLKSPHAIIDTFRTPQGLPGHAEAGIGDIPFGAGPLGKGVSNGLGAALGLKYLKQPGFVDVLMADGDSQEGQIQEAFRLAAHLKLNNLVVHGDFNDIQLSDMPSHTVAADFAAIAKATGWQVIEVQDGNDPGQVVAALKCATRTPSPQSHPSGRGGSRPTFICYYTTMGHGVKVMEEGSNTGKENFHGTPLKSEIAERALKDLPPLDEIIKKYEPYRSKEKARYESGQATQTNFAISWSLPKGYKRTVTLEKGAARQDFGAVHIKNLMKSDPRIFVLHADLAGSGGFDKVQKEFPNSVLNVGVAEANMFMMAAGMRQVGLLPVTYTFAAFGTNEARANARLIDINCGHTRCGVIYDCTHSGVNVGEDGETHQEQNYLNIPFRHTRIWSPADSNQAAAMAEKAFELISDGRESVYVFTGRSGHEQLKNAAGNAFYDTDYVFDGTADIIRGKGTNEDSATIIATGITVHAAVAAADSFKKSIRVLNIAQVRPIDASAIIKAALETRHLIVVEDHNIEGGLSSQIADIIADFALPCSLRRLGLCHYFPSAKGTDLMIMAGIDTESIVDSVKDELTVEVSGGEDAFVSALYELAHHVQHSRFRESALPYIQHLLHQKGYLEHLREIFASRSCPPGKFPKSEDIKKKLADV